MKKNKSKGKTPAKKSAKKTTQKGRQAVDLVEVRKAITNIVGNEAARIAQAVVDEALKGQLAPMKYLFEMAGLYPAAGEAAEAAPEQDSLARTLLRRLGLPEIPVIVPEDDPPILTLPAPEAAAEEGSTALQPESDESKTEQNKGEDSKSSSPNKENPEQPSSTRTNPVE
jgi:hypothetical protein